ncbi:Peptidyl-Lys metalloendopeptidase [Psilocybe cubensis]|uniref:Peptidyl-Lys metalloendopeptidase n=2 Tax=Psilocybe cubensis TaxID=181762 RepID=A0ACB8GSL7_PSICU|nr:Peptidyl-Lys metalloendopeptidase [Psilocybe cubensis]KAH9478705.1 Peptidyl-Lys metalloendopeptidase [Psilocybe cubensis]
MFSFAMRNALIALTTLAVAASAASSLSLEIAGPDQVQTVESLNVMATITNTGDEAIKILNDPRGPLSKLPTDTFTITDSTGAKPAFTGIKVKYVPKTAASIGAYTTLSPGESIKVSHNLGEAYNFTAPGAGAYDIQANNLFYIVKPDNSVSPIYADHASSHRAHISGKLAVTRPGAGALSKRASYTGCSSSQQSALVSAASAAQSYAASSLSYLKSHTSATTRYTTWFGTYTAARYSTVLSQYTKINSNTFSSFTFDCTCTDSGTYAYVYPDTFGHVYLCGAFWSAPTTGTDSKGGTIIHESSHFTSNGGTDDNAYGQSACKSLAKSNPDSAVDNADSHEYFSENNPSLA